jgi:formylglycine-generating enzyme required for sulfatase activity
MLRPNPLGFFDILGNTSEWCHPTGSPPGDGRFVLRGGCYHDAVMEFDSAKRRDNSNTGYSFTGFRLARTIPMDH